MDQREERMIERRPRWERPLTRADLTEEAEMLLAAGFTLRFG